MATHDAARGNAEVDEGSPVREGLADNEAPVEPPRFDSLTIRAIGVEADADVRSVQKELAKTGIRARAPGRAHPCGACAPWASLLEGGVSVDEAIRGSLLGMVPEFAAAVRAELDRRRMLPIKEAPVAYRALLDAERRGELTIYRVGHASWSTTGLGFRVHVPKPKSFEEAMRDAQDVKRSMDEFWAKARADIAQALGMAAASPLAALGLGATAPATDVNQAFRRLALKAHPDRGGSDAAFIELTRNRDAALRRVRGEIETVVVRVG